VTVGELLDQLADELAGPQVPPARADARDLIASLLDKPRFWPSANRALELDEATEGAIRAAAARLKRGMPMQYAVGSAAFRHLTLAVDPRVLIPRPETEVLVDLALMVSGGVGTIADICTGSGCIALALAAEGSYDRVIATDLSADALEVARANLVAIEPDRRLLVDFRQGDLLAPLTGERVRTIVSNPPYISQAEASDLPSAVRDWEPHLALFSADDGMAAIRALVHGAPGVLQPGGVLLMEVDSTRTRLVRDLVEQDPHYRGVEIRLDLTGRERFVVARRKES
jgi:release factor glutamine methyltransferase